MWENRAVRSWSSKLATQHISAIMAFIFVFCSYFFFFLLFLLLLFLLSVSTAVVSKFHLLYFCAERFSPTISACFEFFFMVPKPFTWLALGKKETFDFWIKNGKMFQPLDLWVCDVALIVHCAVMFQPLKCLSMFFFFFWCCRSSTLWTLLHSAQLS